MFTAQVKVFSSCRHQHPDNRGAAGGPLWPAVLEVWAGSQVALRHWACGEAAHHGGTLSEARTPASWPGFKREGEGRLPQPLQGHSQVPRSPPTVSLSWVPLWGAHLQHMGLWGHFRSKLQQTPAKAHTSNTWLQENGVRRAPWREPATACHRATLALPHGAPGPHTGLDQASRCCGLHGVFLMPVASSFCCKTEGRSCPGECCAQWG